MPPRSGAEVNSLLFHFLLNKYLQYSLFDSFIVQGSNCSS